MRNRFAVIVVIAALASATTISVTGQEDPLPRVTPRGAATDTPITAQAGPAAFSSYSSSEPLVILASDPIRAPRTVTLADAAQDNDYATFHALYLEARQQGLDVRAYATLDEIWTFSLTDPLGAFYGAAMVERLERAYPGFRAYIEQHRIVDGRGRAFYPTAETRSFLLAQALRGNEPATRVALTDRATDTPAASAAPQRRPASTASRGAVSRTAPAPRATSRRAAPVRRSTAPERARTTATAAAAERTAPVVPAQPQPVTATLPAPTASTTAPTSTPAVPVPTPAASTSVAEPQGSPVATPVPTPAAAAERPADVPAPIQPSTTGRGLLLLVIGLVGIGILALMLRTPREEMPRSIIDHGKPAGGTAKNGDKPHATVEPIRKRAPKPPSPPAPPRQTGTHS